MSDFEELDRFDPDDPKDPHGDRATLRSLAEAGGDMSKPTHFIHHLYFPDEERSRAAAEEIADMGLDAGGLAPEAPGEQWLVRAEHMQVPSLENVQRMTQALLQIAERHGGDYDGWEAAVES